MSTLTDTDASFHAKEQFRKRIDSDVTLLTTCWYDGKPVEAPKRHYDVARVYDGPLCDSVVMFAERSGIPTCEWIIKTVIAAENIEYRVIDDE